jgi:hypothetical protein
MQEGRMADTDGYQAGFQGLDQPMDPQTNGNGKASGGVVLAAKETVKRRASEMTSSVKEMATETGRDMQSRIEKAADQATSRNGERIGKVARVMRTASEELRLEGEEKLARLTDDAAAQVERVGSYLESEHPSGIMRDLEGMAKKNPAFFLGGTFAVGLLLGRFLRAGSPAPASSGTATTPWDAEEER